MKKLPIPVFALVLAGILFSGCAGSTVLAQTKDDATITYQTFYDNLSPYGTWIDYPGYGHVWNPRIEGEFRPYATDGHWEFSVEGWTWASDYNWGWAPFHYGRWLYDDMYGWLWIPGYEWSPAWVTWGVVDNFYCWAPLMPGLDVSLQFRSWMPHSFYWNACTRDHLYDRHLYGAMDKPAHFINYVSRISLINNFNTTSIHHLYYSKGPDVQEVQKYVHQNIEQTFIKDVNKLNQAGNNRNVMNVYRPAVQSPDERMQHHPEPHEFRKAEKEQVRPINKEEQKPFMERSGQKENIQRLMVHSNGSRPGSSSGIHKGSK